VSTPTLLLAAASGLVRTIGAGIPVLQVVLSFGELTSRRDVTGHA
jgi:hypothetical protein